jgi:hypothetical protein
MTCPVHDSSDKRLLAIAVRREYRLDIAPLMQHANDLNIRSGNAIEDDMRMSENRAQAGDELVARTPEKRVADEPVADAKKAADGIRPRPELRPEQPDNPKCRRYPARRPPTR